MHTTRGTRRAPIALAAMAFDDAAAGCTPTVPTATRLAAAQPTRQTSYPPCGDPPFGVVVDHGGKRVVRPASWATRPTVLPCPELGNPSGLAVDIKGNLDVTDSGSNRVWKLAEGASAPTVLPFAGLTSLADVTVDAAGNVHLQEDGNFRVLKLPAQ